jgi:hypothetical protein
VAAPAAAVTVAGAQRKCNAGNMIERRSSSEVQQRRRAALVARALQRWRRRHMGQRWGQLAHVMREVAAAPATSTMAAAQKGGAAPQDPGCGAAPGHRSRCAAWAALAAVATAVRPDRQSAQRVAVPPAMPAAPTLMSVVCTAAAPAEDAAARRWY